MFIIVKILKFLRQHVYTWETLYLHCAEADIIVGPDGVRELEKQLILFRQYCNKQNS